MSDPLFLTMLSIVLVAVVGTFLRRRSRDKCLKTFSGDTVTLEQTGGKGTSGRLRVEITGLELLYAQSHQDAGGHIETSYILYKQEYAKIQALARYVDQLDEKGTKKRARELRAADHPSALRRLRRKFTNLFNTFRDSVMEAVNLFIGRAKKGPGIGSVLSSQDKYVSELRTDLFNSVGTAFEPLLERHIGKHVILEMIRGDKVVEYAGILKDYTADFLSLMDIDYTPSEEDTPRKADLIVPRTVGVIRHLAE